MEEILNEAQKSKREGENEDNMSNQIDYNNISDSNLYKLKEVIFGLTLDTCAK